MSATRNESLARRLTKAEVYHEFCELLFAQEIRYEDLLEQLEKWGISSSLGAISRFADSERSQYTLDRAKRQYEAMLKDESVDLDQAQRRMVAERLFNLAASPHITEKSLLKLRELEIKAAQLENDRRRIAILEGKIKSASDKLEELRNPDVANDEEMRLRVLDAVDEAMGIKKK